MDNNWVEDAEKRLEQVIGPGYEGTVNDFDRLIKQSEFNTFILQHLTWSSSGSISPEYKQLLNSPDYKIKAQQEYTALHQGILKESTAEFPQLDETTGKPAKHKGRTSEYTLEERDQTVKDRIDRGPNDVRTVEVYLVDCFGEKDSDSFDPKPIVSRSAYYYWRTDYLKRTSESN